MVADKGDGMGWTEVNGLATGFADAVAAPLDTCRQRRIDHAAGRGLKTKVADETEVSRRAERRLMM